MSCQMNKDTTEKAPENFIGEILDTTKEVRCVPSNPHLVFPPRKTGLLAFKKFQVISKEFANF